MFRCGVLNSVLRQRRYDQRRKTKTTSLTSTWLPMCRQVFSPFARANGYTTTGRLTTSQTLHPFATLPRRQCNPESPKHVARTTSLGDLGQGCIDVVFISPVSVPHESNKGTRTALKQARGRATVTPQHGGISQTTASRLLMSPGYRRSS